MSFESELKKFSVIALGNSEKVFRGTFLSLTASVIKRSPVGNPDLWVAFDKTKGAYVDYQSIRSVPEGYIGGRFRGNWQTDVNKPPSGEVDTISKTGAEPLAKAKIVAFTAKLEDSLYLVNNLPYAVPLENGSSTQAPHGMVKRTVAEFNREVEKQARKLK